MREILFRGKRMDNGEWLYGDLRQWTEKHKGICDYKQKRTIDVCPATVGQFTGLTDKNGKKIFEGDIVKYSDIDYCYYDEEATIFVGRIKYEVGSFGIATQDVLPDLGYSLYCANDNFISLWEIYWNENETEDCINSIEVIGNINDNKDLLEDIGRREGE